MRPLENLELIRMSDRLRGNFPLRLVRAADVNTAREAAGRPALGPGKIILSRTLAARSGVSAGDTVIFDRDYQAVEGGSVQFATSEPMVTCRTADVSGAAQGDAIVIDSVSHTVQVVMDDGTGMTQLMLSED